MNEDMLILELVLLLLGAFILVKATEIVINNVNQLSEDTQLAKFGLAAVLVAASTSFPELFVGITSGLSGVPSLSLGNVIGSNIANVSLVVGLAAVVSGSIAITGEYMKRDLFYGFLVGGIPFVLLSDGRLNRLEAIALIVGYFFYVHQVLRKKHPKSVRAERVLKAGRYWQRLGLFGGSQGKSLVRVLVGVGVVVVAAELVVRMGMLLAARLDVPVLLVGLFIVAIGTSLPELSLWVREAVNREGALVFGNLLGSIMTNALLVVGVSALIRPIEVVAVESYLIATVAYVVLFGLFWRFTASRQRLDRKEGLVLIGLYLLFIAIEFLKENGYQAWVNGALEWLWRQAQLLV